MDQLAILATPKGCYLDLDFGDETSRKSSGQGVSFALAPFTSVPQVTPRPFCPSLRDDYRVVLFNTGRKHQLSDGSYATRREECQAALQGLLSGQPLHRGPTKAEPPATTLGDWFRRLPTWAQGDLVHAEDQALEAIEASLQDPLLRRRAVFVAQEILRVEQTIQAMANDAPATIDAVLRRAQAGLRDDYEISCPEVDLAVDLIGAAKSSLHLQTPSTAPLIIGPRMMGGGWGGSLILWIKTSAHGAILDALNDVAQRYSISSGCQAELIETCPERGLAEPWPWSSGASQTKVHQPV
jgi:galactokinase